MRVAWLLLLLISLLVTGVMGARKTAKEWASFKAVEDDAREDSAEDVAYKAAAAAKHALIRVTFGSGYSPHERNLVSQTWHEQLLQDGIQIKVYGGTGKSLADDTSGNSLLVASQQFGQVWEYFLSHIADMPEVMMVKMEGEARFDSELWNLPKYRREFDEDNRKAPQKQSTEL